MNDRCKTLIDNTFVGIVTAVTIGIFFFGSQMVWESIKDTKSEIKNVQRENEKISKDLISQEQVLIDAISDLKAKSILMKSKSVGKGTDSILILNADFDRSRYSAVKDSIKSNIGNRIDSVKNERNWDKTWDRKWEK